MADSNDWDEAFREVIVAARAGAGAPPTDEELLAYSRGELPEAEAARMREHLALHPELIRPLFEPIPDLYRGEPGDPDYLSDDQMEADWARLEASISTPVRGAAPAPAGGTVVPFRRALQTWRFSTLAAALIACLLGGLYLRTLGELRRQETPRLAPEYRVLLPDGERGSRGEQPPIAVPLPSAAQEFLLIPSLIDVPRYPRYRVDIVDLQDPQEKVVWRLSNARRTSNDTFEILVPRAFLSPGEYRLDVYGLSGRRWERLSSYTVAIAPE